MIATPNKAKSICHTKPMKKAKFLQIRQHSKYCLFFKRIWRFALYIFLHPSFLNLTDVFSDHPTAKNVISFVCRLCLWLFDELNRMKSITNEYEHHDKLDLDSVKVLTKTYTETLRDIEISEDLMPNLSPKKTNLNNFAFNDQSTDDGYYLF